LSEVNARVPLHFLVDITEEGGLKLWDADAVQKKVTARKILVRKMKKRNKETKLSLGSLIVQKKLCKPLKSGKIKI